MSPRFGLRAALILLVLIAAGPALLAGLAADGEPLAQRPLARIALLLLAALVAALAWGFGEQVIARPVRQLLARLNAVATDDRYPELPMRVPRVRELAALHQGLDRLADQLAERAVERDGALGEMAHQKMLVDSVLASMGEGLLACDRQGRLVQVNRAAAGMLPGLVDLNRSGGLLSMDPAAWGVRLLDGRPCTAAEWPVARALAGHAVPSFRLRIEAPLATGRLVVQGSARPMRTPEGQPGGAVLVLTDATATWEAEQALVQSEQRYRLLSRSLERRVEERTRELSRINQELESFSYSVSHDLRSPLQVIDGFGKVLLERHASELDDRGRHYLARILDNTARMEQLIDDLLALARVSRSPMVAEPVDLSVRAAQIVERLRQRFPSRAVEVLIEPGLQAQGDPRLMTVALENLLDNAWKFTARRADARVQLGATVLEAGERAFFVADNGAGFDMAYAERLFAPFQRLHAQADFEGTGVGLATVQRIIARHGGRIWAEAAPGAGATFRFTLGPAVS